MTATRLENTWLLYNATAHALVLWCMDGFTFADGQLEKNVSCECSHTLTSWIDDVTALGACTGGLHIMDMRMFRCSYSRFFICYNYKPLIMSTGLP